MNRELIIFLKIVQINHQEVILQDKIKCQILIILKLIQTLKEQIFLIKDHINFQIFLRHNLHQVIRKFKIVKIKELLLKISGETIHKIGKVLIDFLHNLQEN